MKSVKKYFSILFLLVGILTIFEFLFIQGMFTSILMMFAVVIVGLINMVFELKDRQWIYALQYLLASIALCMGYIPLL